MPLTGEADAKRALHTAACNIYHACVHNFVHEESAEVLKTLYKSAFFALQAKHYLETGAYIAKRKDLANKLQGERLFRAAFKLGCGCYKKLRRRQQCRNRKLK